MIRCTIYGFKIEEVKSLEGSKNQIALKKVLDKLYDGDDPEIDEYIKAKEIAKLFFNESSMAAGFENETDDHWYFIKTLIYTQDDITYTDFEGYDVGACFDFFEKIKNESSQDIKIIIDYFLNGRSIFISKAGRGPAYQEYAILKLSEIEILINELEKNVDKYKENTIYNPFLSALKRLRDKKMDLFFLVS